LEYITYKIIITLLKAADKLFDHIVIPKMPFDAAAPKYEAAVAAPPALTTQPAYVYLLRVVRATQPVVRPNANIPTVLLPAARPPPEAAVAAVPALTTQPA
jgi:hypothetical protein